MSKIYKYQFYIQKAFSIVSYRILLRNSMIMNLRNKQKQITFVTTFCLYVGIHMMRMSYSFNKSNIKKKFMFDGYFLGILDAFVYIALGIGFFLRFKLIQSGHLTKILLKTSILISMFFCIIPIISLLNLGIDSNSGANQFIKLICSISLLSFGFCQLAIWPITFTLVSFYYDPKVQGTMIGCWSSNGDIGNIAGFLISQIFMYNFGGQWQLSMIISALFTITMAILVQKFVDISEHYKESKQLQKDSIEIKQDIITSPLMQQNQNNKEKYQNSTFGEFLNFVLTIICHFESCLFVITTSLYKSILYGFLLWCPIFLVSIGQDVYSGLIPMIFNISTLVGSLILGKLYEQQQNQNQQSNQNDFCFGIISYTTLKKYKLLFASVILFLGLLLFSIVKSVLSFSILAFVMGCSLGGIFNMLVANQLLVLTKGHLKNTQLMSTFTMSIGNTIVGVLQLVIAVVLLGYNKNVNQKYQSYSVVFKILVITTFIATLLLLTRILSSKGQTTPTVQNQQNKPPNQIQMKETKLKPEIK